MKNKEIFDLLEKISKELNTVRNHIFTDEIHFMKEHNFKMEEEALRYKA